MYSFVLICSQPITPSNNNPNLNKRQLFYFIFIILKMTFRETNKNRKTAANNGRQQQNTAGRGVNREQIG